MRAQDSGLIQQFDADSAAQRLIQEYDDTVFSSANDVRERNDVAVGAHVPLAT